MKARALPLPRTRKPLLIRFIGGLTKLIRALAARIPEGKAHPRYTGHFGADSKTVPYDQMTTADHDAAGGIWADMARGDE